MSGRKAYPLVALLLAAGTASAAEAPYCAAYSGSICFSSGEGDTVTHKIIIDFTIDEVQLKQSAHLTIYQGVGLSEQEDAGTIEQVKAYDAPGGNIVLFAGSKRPNRYFDIHFKAKDGSGTVQIFGYLKDSAAAQAVAEFVSAVHPCKREQLKVACTADAPFAAAGALLPGLVK